MTLNAKSTRRDSGRRSARLLLAVLIALVELGCDRSGPLLPGRGRVLLVGLDAARLRVAAPLMKKGLLPNLARIAQ